MIFPAFCNYVCDSAYVFMDDYVVDMIMTYIRFLGIATKTIWHEKYTGELKTRFKKNSGGGVISQTDILDPIISTVIRILDFNSHYEMISYFQKLNVKSRKNYLI